MIPTVKTDIQKIKLMREAASVRRCHTAFVIGEYNIGYHTFNMLAMLRYLYPDCRQELIWAIIEHDIPERLTGDIPAPAKWHGLLDNSNYADFEARFTVWLFGDDYSAALTDNEKGWLKGLDLLELYLWCLDQISLGNVNAAVMKRRAYEHMAKQPNIPVQIREQFAQASRTDWVIQEDL